MVSKTHQLYLENWYQKIFGHPTFLLLVHVRSSNKAKYITSVTVTVNFYLHNGVVPNHILMVSVGFKYVGRRLSSLFERIETFRTPFTGSVEKGFYQDVSIAQNLWWIRIFMSREVVLLLLLTWMFVAMTISNSSNMILAATKTAKYVTIKWNTWNSWSFQSKQPVKALQFSRLTTSLGALGAITVKLIATVTVSVVPLMLT